MATLTYSLYIHDEKIQPGDAIAELLFVFQGDFRVTFQLLLAWFEALFSYFSVTFPGDARKNRGFWVIWNVFHLGYPKWPIRRGNMFRNVVQKAFCRVFFELVHTP
jgi:hypothetical protein